MVPMITLRRTGFSFSALVLMAGALFSQTTLRLNSDSSSFNVGQTTSGMITLAQSPAIQWNQSTVFIGAPTETRKLDTRGPSLAQVKLAAFQLTQKQLAPAIYISMANSIGLDGPQTDEARLLQIIFDQELKVYDPAKVDAYLYREALKQGAQVRWVWKPMRSKDLESAKAASYRQFDAGYVAGAQYAKPLPLRVLAGVKEILERMPDAVFLVSDFEVVRPDPFLAVTSKKLIEQGKLWIINCWDEPGFEDKIPVKLTLAQQ